MRLPGNQIERCANFQLSRSRAFGSSETSTYSG
jgi:hypothetical protein